MFKIAAFLSALVCANTALADDIAPMALNSFSAVPPKFAEARVFQQDGSLLGNIQAVVLAPGGSGHVLVGVSGGRKITFSAADASYDEGANVVVTEASATKRALGTP